MKIHRKSAWSKDQIVSYLQSADTPIRVACNDSGGYPLICSLWFFYDEGSLWAACHSKAYLVKALQKDSRVAFEVATNVYPYKGVRGKADVELFDHGAGETLERLIEKYLKGNNQSLANWLLSRKEDELALKMSPTTITAWDFSDRMEPEEGDE